MSEAKLFGGEFKFKTEVAKVVTVLHPNTKVHVKVDSGPRVDEFMMYLAVGPDPHGDIANGGTAGTSVPDNGKPIDVTWIIPKAGIYVFVLRHNPGDRSHPIKKVVATVNVYCDPPAIIGTELQTTPIHEITDPLATPVTDPDNVKPTIIHGTGGSGTGSAGSLGGSGLGGSGSGPAPTGTGPAEPNFGSEKPDASGAGSPGSTTPTAGVAASGNPGTPSGTTTGTPPGTGTPDDGAPAPATPDEADANLTVPDAMPGQQPSQSPTSPVGPTTVPKETPGQTPDGGTPVAPTPATPEPDSTLIAGGGGPAPTDPTDAGGPTPVAPTETGAPGGPTPGDPAGTGGPAPSDPTGDGPPPPDPTTGDPPPPPPPEFPADWVTLVPNLLTATAIKQLGVSLGASAVHVSAGARGIVATHAQSALHAAAVHAGATHEHRGSHHHATVGVAASPRAFAYLLPGSAAQVVRLRDPKSGANCALLLQPNTVLIYRAELEREPTAAGHDAHAVLHGVLTGSAS